MEPLVDHSLRTHEDCPQGTWGPPTSRGRSLRRALVFLSFLPAGLLLPRIAEAALDAGAEVGIAKRSASSPGDLKLGLGWQLHAEASLLPFIQLGPYYAHYGLDIDAPSGGDATFNALGLRARFVLPLPISVKPYVYAGVGYSWVTYDAGATHANGHFVETPLGGGLLYEPLPLLGFTLDGAYRPGTGFGGDAYDRRSVPTPSSGFTVMLGASLRL